MIRLPFARGLLNEESALRSSDEIVLAKGKQILLWEMFFAESAGAKARMIGGKPTEFDSYLDQGTQGSKSEKYPTRVQTSAKLHSIILKHPCPIDCAALYSEDNHCPLGIDVISRQGTAKKKAKAVSSSQVAKILLKPRIAKL